MDPSKFGSRKFIVTMTGMILTAVVAYLGVMDNNVAMVFTASIAGYHLANAYTTGKGAEK